MRARCTTSLLACVAIAMAAAGPATAQQPPDRCEAAKQLIEGGAGDIAAKQLQKALDVPELRQCAVDALNAQAAAKKAEAKQEQHDDDRVTPAEAVGAVWTQISKSWPWLAGLFLVWTALLVYRLLKPGGIRMTGAKDNDAVAQMVMEAANATGTGGRPAKVFVAGDGGLSSDTVANISRLLGLPAGNALDALLTLATGPLRYTRMSVSFSEAAGWAVLDVELHRLFHWSRKARLALHLEGRKTKTRQEALALVAGAWLATVNGIAEPGSPIRYADWQAAEAHAYFRAGANLQDRGETETALSCYAAMSEAVEADHAPFAWVGARLNLMVALHAQGRADEARAVACAVRRTVLGVLNDAERIAWYDPQELTELRQRTAYMIAGLYEDLANDDVPVPEAEAAAAHDHLAQVQPDAQPTSTALHRAIRLLNLCHRIRVHDPNAPVMADDVRAVLHAGLAPGEAAVPPLAPVVYYDAACAFALLASRVTIEVGDTAEQKATKRRERRDLTKEALSALTLAVAASSADSRGRVRAMAAADPMLKSLHEPGVSKTAAAFRAALGTPDPEPDPDLRLAIATREDGAAAAAAAT